MDDAEIQRIAAELDEAITKDDAKLLIDCGCGSDEGEGQCELIANRKGFLRGHRNA